MNSLQKPDGIEVVHVVAMDEHRCIGGDNRLLWHIPEDLKHFKQHTLNQVIVMGRKTFESLGRVLPQREHWVLSHNTAWTPPNTVQVRHHLTDLIQDAAYSARQQQLRSIYIIGGGQLYAATLPITDRIEATHVLTQVTGDTYYPAIPAHFNCTAQPIQQCATSALRYYFASYISQHNLAGKQ